jgi:Fe-S cluster assembly protein SufD
MGQNHDMELSLEFAKNISEQINFFLIASPHMGPLKLSFLGKENVNVEITQMIIGRLKSPSHIERKVSLAKNALMKLTTAILMDGMLTMNDSAVLLGEEANFQSELLVIGQHNDDISITQKVDHKAKKSYSTLNNSLVANDQSHLKFDIYGTIHKYRAQSQCFQHSKGILLGEKAWIEIDPKLIINEFDVEAGHGAAVGQINQDELYYLSSRGLDELLAKRLIIQGYTDPFVTAFPLIQHQKYINQAIARKMGGR